MTPDNFLPPVQHQRSAAVDSYLGLIGLYQCSAAVCVVHASVYPPPPPPCRDMVQDICSAKKLSVEEKDVETAAQENWK